jgi:hypothetical protein
MISTLRRRVYMRQGSIFIFVLCLATVAAAIVACNNSSTPGTPVTYSSNPGSNSTPTATFTNTFICSATPTPTFTIVPNLNTVVVVINYTGGGTVNSSNVIAAYLTNAIGSGATTQLVQTSATNGKTFTFTNLNAGNYYFAAVYDATGVGYTAPSGNFNPHIGDDYAFYTGAGTTSGTPPGGGIAGSGNVVLSGAANNLGTVSFDSTNAFQGVSGTINYTGTKGNVDCRNLFIETFQDAGYTVSIGTTQVSSNNTHYDQLDLGTVTSGQTVYVLAWYDYSDLGSAAPSTGDPVTLYGAATSPATSANINLTDAHIQ